MPMLNVRSMSSLGHGAGALEPAEERRHIPRSQADDGVGPWRQHPRQVVGDAAAGDVRHPLDQRRRRSSGRMSGRYDRCGASSASPTVVPSSGTSIAHAKPQAIEHDPARERIAVGVQAGRRQADQDVAGDDSRGRRSAVRARRAPTMKPATSYSPSA